uniref:Uncharacterized protein n=1 Tax=Lactuca sativa TaxID=4236 RepID=A0A9R1XEL9_LACSA|nr:hypothetical protein LSAT_V11C400192150 [Lactuca sativa]
MSSRLQNPFVGAAFQSSLKPRNVNCLGYLGNKFPRKPRYDIIPRAKKNDWISHGISLGGRFASIPVFCFLQYPPFSYRNPSNVLDHPISEINSESVSTTFRYDIVASTGLPSRRSRPSFLDSILPNEEKIKQLIHSVQKFTLLMLLFYLFIYLLNFIFSIISASLGTYEDNRFKSESKKPYLKSIGSLNLGGGPELEKKLKYTEHVCSGVILGKELVNAPPNVLTPGVSTEEAEKIASTIDCDKLSDIGSEYEGFWIDTADKQPCIGMGGMIPWKLHVTRKLFHSGLAHKVS